MRQSRRFVELFAVTVERLHTQDPLVDRFEIAELRSGLKVEAYGVETTAVRHGTPHLASLGKIIPIVSDDNVGIKRVSALPAIAVGIVQAEFFGFAHS